MKKINILFLLMTLLVASCRFAEEEDFLASACYEDYFAIVYNSKNGLEKNYKNNRLQYNIPDNRILVTEYPRQKGILDQNLYIIGQGAEMVENQNCSIKNSLQTVLSISNFEFEDNYNKDSEIRYKYYTLFYFVGSDTGSDSSDFSAFKNSIRSYLIENNIKSKDSVIIQN